MAKLNKYMAIGRLGGDPEKVDFRSTGGYMAKFSLCVNERKKNTATGEWEDDPMWLDCEVFNYGEKGTLADVVLDYCRKGKQVFCEGHLKQDKWEDRETGQKRSKIKFVITNLQMLDKKEDEEGGGSRSSGNRDRGNARDDRRPGGTRPSGDRGGAGGGNGGRNTGGGTSRQPARGYEPPDEYDRPAPGGMSEDDIPF